MRRLYFNRPFLGANTVGQFSCLPRVWCVRFFLLSVLFFGVDCPEVVGQNFEDITPSYLHLDMKEMPDVGITNRNDLLIAVATDQEDNIYTLSLGNGIQKRDAEGNILNANFITGLDSPLDLAVDADGFFYTAEFFPQGDTNLDNGRIRVFDQNGNYVRIIGESYYRPMGIDVDDQYLYVAEYDDAQNGWPERDPSSRVRTLDKETGEVIHVNNDVVIPYRIAADSQRNVYVSQAGIGDPVVKVFNENLIFQRELSNIESPGSLVVDAYDFLHVVEYAGRIDFSRLLDFENLEADDAIDLLHQVYHGIDDEVFHMKIYNSDHILVDSYKQEVDFPIDLAFNDCDRMYLLNSRVIPLYHVQNWLTHSFLPLRLETDLDTYKRTPTFDSLKSPEITCPGDIEVTADPGEDFVIVEFENATATDNCSASVEQKQGLASGSEFTLGTHTIEFTATDAAGLTDNCSFTITVNPSEDEDTPPEAICNNFEMSLDENGIAEITAEQIYGGNEDLELSIDSSSFDCSNLGANTVVLTVTDEDTGLSDTCEATIIVVDEIAPLATCAAPFVVELDANGEASIAVADVDNGSTDNCEISSRTLSQYNFTRDDIGLVPVVLTITDSSGLTDQCTVNITVEDNTPPEAICSDFEVSLDENGIAEITAEQVYGGSEDLQLSINIGSFDCSNLGANTVVLTVTDEDTGLSNTCEATITVVDEVAPLAACASPFTIELDENGEASITIDDVDNGSTDNCEISSSNLSQYNFTRDDLGVVPVTLTITDNSGLSDQCIIEITVAENSNTDPPDPIFACSVPENLFLELNEDCTIDTQEYSDFIVNPQNFENTVYVEQEERINGNSMVVTLRVYDGEDGDYIGLCSFEVDLRDVTAPETTSCNNSPLEINLDAGESYTIDNFSSRITAMDECDEDISIIQDPPEGTVITQTTTVSFTVLDEAGNENTSCSFEITVNETPTDPSSDCLTNYTLELDSEGEGTLNPEDLYTGDPAGINFELDRENFTCEDIGTQEVVLSYSGADSGSCTIPVTIKDITAPVVVCLDNYNITVAPGESRRLTAEELDSGSYDACGDVIFELSRYVFTEADAGRNSVNLIVSDEYGNTDTCPVTVQVSVEGSETDFECLEEYTIQLDAYGEAALSAEDLISGNGTGVTFNLDKENFTCEDLGPQMVTLEYSGGGVNGSCEIEITVEDNLAPVASCVSEFTLYLNQEGYGILSGSIIDNGSTDNCQIEEMILDKTYFDAEDLGQQEVTLTVRDAAGNTDTCTAMVTVEPYDEEREVGCAGTITLPLDENGEANLNLRYTGNEENEEVEVSKSYFTCDDLGTETVTATYWGEFAGSCEIEINVVDNLPPQVSCISDYDLQLSEDGTAALSVDDVHLSSSDNCGIETMFLSQTTFTTADIGSQQVTLSVVDYSGNRGTCTITVNIEPQEGYEAPVECVDAFTLELGADGTASLGIEELYSGGTEEMQVEVNRTEFTCADVGEQVVIFTYNTGNDQGSCEITIYVTDPNDHCTIDPVEPSPPVAEGFYLTIYPNPGRGLVYVSTNGDLDLTRAEVFDMRGRFLFSKEFPETDNDRDKVIDLREFQSGVYAIIYYTENRKFIRRAIISRD